jgi:hypothetical protein
LEKSRASIKPEEKATIMGIIKDLSASIERSASPLYYDNFVEKSVVMSSWSELRRCNRGAS